MVQQVRMPEKYSPDGRRRRRRTRRVFAFGTHAMATEADAQRPVTDGDRATGNRLPHHHGRAPRRQQPRRDRVPRSDRQRRATRACRSARRPTTSRAAPPRRTCCPQSCPGPSRAVCICDLDTGCVVGSTIDREGRAGRRARHQPGRRRRRHALDRGRGRHPVRRDRRADRSRHAATGTRRATRTGAGDGRLRGARPGDRARAARRGLPTNLECGLRVRRRRRRQAGQRSVCAPADGDITAGLHRRATSARSSSRSSRSSSQPSRSRTATTGVSRTRSRGHPRRERAARPGDARRASRSRTARRRRRRSRSTLVDEPQRSRSTLDGAARGEHARTRSRSPPR